MGALSKTAATTSSANFNLTTLGTLGWAAWAGIVNSFAVGETKSGGLTITAAGASGTSAIAYNDSRTASWTDGTPTTSGSTVNSRYTSGGSPNGYTVTVPADTSAKLVRLYLGVFSGIATVTATLSDSSASPVTDSTTFDSVSASTFFPGYIEFDYVANSGSQTLTILVSLTTDYGGGNCALNGVAIAVGVGGGSVNVTDVDTDETIRSDQTNAVATGTDFGATAGTLSIIQGGIVKAQSIDSWADTSIQFDVTFDT